MGVKEYLKSTNRGIFIGKCNRCGCAVKLDPWDKRVRCPRCGKLMRIKKKPLDYLGPGMIKQ